MNQRTFLLTFITLLVAIILVVAGIAVVWFVAGDQENESTTSDSVVSVTEQANPTSTPEVLNDGVEDTASDTVTTAADMEECGLICEESCEGFAAEEEKVDCLEECSALCERY